MSRPRVLIEQWLPIDQIGAECMRERSLGKNTFPPHTRLHVWWARRPLTVSRAAILASVLPAYPTGEDDNGRAWPDRLLKQYPTFEVYKTWFLNLIGIYGNPAAARKLIQWAITNNSPIPNPYGYSRAFTVNPSPDQLKDLYDLLEWAWGTRDITFSDPMAGGGSIPLEALRYGLSVHANELNPVASVVLKATLDFPARFGPSLVADIRKYGDIWAKAVRERLRPFFSAIDDNAIGACFIWARTVPCPLTGKPVPLSPNWWLKKGAEPVAIRVIARDATDRCEFEIVRGKSACEKLHPDKGTIRKGSGVTPWVANETIDGDYIKQQAKAGNMKEQLVAVGTKSQGKFIFRAATSADEQVVAVAEAELMKRWPALEAKGLIPTEPRREGRADWACEIYGINRWCDTYTKRQLLALVTMVECLRDTVAVAEKEIGSERSHALQAYLAIAVDKAADYDSKQVAWDVTRQKIAHGFSRHDLSMRWTFAEFDASSNLADFCVSQIHSSASDLAKFLTSPPATLFGPGGVSPVNRLRLCSGSAQSLTSVPSESIRCITVDPPYYDNVNYAECSNYFLVWMKRSLDGQFPDLFNVNDPGQLANEDDEAIMNVARFKDAGKKAKQLAAADYENKMYACFCEMQRVLTVDGVLTVMFTHKKVEAWDTLGSALIRAGFRIDASWPVNTESDKSLHQAKKNAAASTILLVCRKREKTSEPVWWDDLKGKVREIARQKAAEFEQQGIKGVDLYISTFGPVLSIISENWPVLTSETDTKSGDPLPLKPGEALDLAREEVINLRKQGLLLGRSVEFDPVTDWYLMAWDAFRAQEFPADEARKLALALGLDLEQDVIKDKKLVAKKSGTVVICKPADRRKKNMVDDDAESFSSLIDALHTAMMIYDEEGSKACQVFVDRQGLRNDSRIKALVQAMMEAIPTTRGKDSKFLRPEMTTLDAMRALFWEDLPAPKEEEPPKIDKQATFLDAEAADEENEEELDEELEEEED